MTPPPLLETAYEVKEFYVYLLRSLKDNRLYLGWTTNIQRRLDEHNEGSTTSTRNRRPFELVYYETYASAKSAKKRERLLKKNPRMYSYFKKKVLCSSILKNQKEVVG